MAPSRVAMFVLRAARSLGRTLAEFGRLPLFERVAWCVMAEWDEHESGIRKWHDRRTRTATE